MRVIIFLLLKVVEIGGLIILSIPMFELLIKRGWRGFPLWFNILNGIVVVFWSIPWLVYWNIKLANKLWDKIR